MKGFPLLLCVFIWTYLVCFAMTKWPSSTLISLSVSTNEPSIKPEMFGVLCQFGPVSKIKLVSCELSTKSLLGLSALEDIRSIYAYSFCDSFLSILLYDTLSISVDIYALV